MKKIRNFNWNDVINDTFSADEACNNFNEVYVNLCKSCIPRKLVVIRPSDRPWFTSELRHNIRIRDRLRRKALKSNSEQDIERFKAQRNKVNNMKKFARETYMNNYEDMILGQNCGSKSFWQLMGRLAGKQSKTSNIPPFQTPNDSYAFTNSEQANTLNDYFCSISSIDDTNSTSLSNILISPSEVSDILSNLN